MANYNASAEVVLSVNGKQAQKILSGLEKDAKKLEAQLKKATAAGDVDGIKKYEKELNKVNNIIGKLKNAGNETAKTLSALDKATPKELNRALRDLTKQLNGIERGSKAWDEQVAKIRLVRGELQRVNTTLATQQGSWGKLNTWINNCQTALFGAAASITGMVMAARNAVSAYADMEEALANTQKYTRMTRTEVEELNAIFKQMDTRLSVEQLHALAQEAGRLGYNTVDSVKQYVDAAAQINVALVDLGEGATQTIAKLTNIFGVEQLYGVREAMLKVGSTVNHLSQNCTAAKPFIVEFAQRMAGIGSTAKMTIPDIMAFAATLDANGQKVEMSATAIQRVIMELYKDTSGMAKKVGLDSKQLTETLNKNTTQGVIMFLEALNKLGESNALAVLSPLFQDLGLDGARVSSVLTNLSSHLGFLKWQLGEAATAFKEGTSASGEYAIFNNTVQASIDKAKKRVTELSVELGEKLYPIMKHVYTSSSVLLRVVNTLTDFIINHRTAIGNIVIILAAYNAGLLVSKTVHGAYNLVVNAGNALMKAYNITVATGKAVIAAFNGGLKAAIVSMKALNTATKMNAFGAMLAAIAAVVLAIKSLIPTQDEFTKKVKEAIQAARGYSSEMLKEQHELDKLFGRLKSADKASKDYKDAKSSIINQYGKYLTGLINERGEITNLTLAYNRLTYAIRRSAKERSIDQAEQNLTDQYYTQLRDNLNRLQTMLESYGATAMEASEITQIVSDALNSGTQIPEDIKRRINEISATGTPTKDANGNELNLIERTFANTMAVDAPQPAAIVNLLWQRMMKKDEGLSSIEKMRESVSPLRSADEDALKFALSKLEGIIKSNVDGFALVYNQATKAFDNTLLSVDAAKKLYQQYNAELIYRRANTSTTDITGGNPDFNPDTFTPYETERDRKQREIQERHRKTKERADFRLALDEAKGDWERADTQNTADYSAGVITYKAYLDKKQEILLKYFTDREALYKKFGLANAGDEDEDYLALLKNKTETIAKWEQGKLKRSLAEIQLSQKSEESQLQMDFYTPGSAVYGNEEALQTGLFEIRYKYLEQTMDLYQKTSEEYLNYQRQLEELEQSEQLRRRKLYISRIEKWRKQYEYQSASERLNQELAILEAAYEQKLLSEEEYQQAVADLKKQYQIGNLPESAKPETDNSADNLAKEKDLKQIESLYNQGLVSEEEYQSAKERIEKFYNNKQTQRVRQIGSEHTNQLLDIYEAWKNFFDKSNDDGENWASKLGKLASSVFAVMNAGMQQYSEYAQASADLEIAKTEKKYNREIELAEGNSYKVKKLEKQRDKETARIKNDANKKMFAMQVIQAVAQTATNALNAYGSAAAVPVVGYILAPIAAAMATAAGIMQIATIKKQQQASEAQGYAQGGFTADGDVNQPAGIVHAGEWVASQKLVKSPTYRPFIDFLENAQRNNTIGSISAGYVSQRISGGMFGKSDATSEKITVVQTSSPENDKVMNRLNSALDNLNRRLDEPFVTVNTVTGDNGIKKALDDYNSLINNKSKRRR